MPPILSEANLNTISNDPIRFSCFVDFAGEQHPHHTIRRSARNIWQRVLLTLALCMASNAALADLPGNSNIYAAVGASYITGDGDVDDIDLDDDDFAGTARIGYLFGSFIGAEIGYFDLGELNEDELSVDADAFTAALVVNAPLSIIDIYGKVGIVRVDADVEIDSSIGDISFGEDSTEAFFALGGEFDLGPVNIFAEYARIDADFDLDINVYTAGLKLEF